MNFEVVEAKHKRKKRFGPWVGIIIHHTDIGGRKKISESLWRRLGKGITSWLADNDKYVSCHFIIDRFGEITQLVDPDKFEAFHAGRSEYYHPIRRRWVSDWNRHAIGIELLGDGNLHKYSEEQYFALAGLCRYLLERYPYIDPRCITGHENIAPKRKIDPGKHFDWNRLFELVFD